MRTTVTSLMPRTWFLPTMAHQVLNLVSPTDNQLLHELEVFREDILHCCVWNMIALGGQLHDYSGEFPQIERLL